MEDDAPNPAAADATPDRPTDEQILSYENQLRDAQREHPLLGEREAIDELFEEYEQDSTFAHKLRSLKGRYECFRRTRPDGNCFYRSLLFGLLETLLMTGNSSGTRNLISCVKEWKAKLVEFGYQEIVFEDAQQILLELLETVASETATLPELLIKLRSEELANHLIMFVRLVTSAEIQRREEHFMPFVAGMTDEVMDLPDFCRKYVECMGEESDHVQLVAAASAFQVEVKVAYLDNSAHTDAQGQLVCDELTFGPEGCRGEHCPSINLLYRPGHYDILYGSRDAARLG